MKLPRRAVLGVTMLGALVGPSAAAAAAGRIDVAVAIDFGAGGRDPVATCVSVPAGSSGATALDAALGQLGLPRATYASSGLLCSIGAWPGGSECGRRDASGYHYWSYFHGGPGGWTYASNGPAANRASESSAEGWRFQDAGTGRPGDPAPRLSATDRARCAALHVDPQPEVTTTTTSPTPTTAANRATPPTTVPPAANPAAPPSSRPSSRPAPALEQVASRSAKPAAPSGSPWVSGLAALALLGGGAGLAWWRRARRR